MPVPPGSPPVRLPPPKAAPQTLKRGTSATGAFRAFGALEDLRIPRCDFGWQRLALRRERQSRAEAATAIVDVGIEQQRQERTCHLEAALQGAGAGLAGKLGERVADLLRRKVEDIGEARRQDAAAGDEAVDRIPDIDRVRGR